MVKIDMAKKLGGLHPVDEDGEKVMRGLKLGEIVSVDVVRPSNIAFHNKLRAGRSCWCIAAMNPGQAHTVTCKEAQALMGRVRRKTNGKG